MKRNTGKVQIFLTTGAQLPDFLVFYWSDPVFANESNPKISSLKSDICLTHLLNQGSSVYKNHMDCKIYIICVLYYTVEKFCILVTNIY